MGTIKKNTNLSKVTWEVRIRKHNHPTITKTFFLKSHAERWARDTELKIETGVFDIGFEQSEETLGAVLGRYLQEVIPKKRGQDVEAVRMNKFINTLIATHKISLLKSIHTEHIILTVLPFSMTKGYRLKRKMGDCDHEDIINLCGCHCDGIVRIECGCV